MVTVSSALNWWMLFCFVALRVCKCASERTISEQSKANGYCYLFEHTANQTKLCCLLLRMRSERRGRIWNVLFWSGKPGMPSIAIMFHCIWDVHKWTSSTKLTNSGQRLKIHIQEFSPWQPCEPRQIIHLCSQSFTTFSSFPFSQYLFSS